MERAAPAVTSAEDETEAGTSTVETGVRDSDRSTLLTDWQEVALNIMYPQRWVSGPIFDEPYDDYSKVRITFNRPLTWAEREHFRTLTDQSKLFMDHRFQYGDPSILTVESRLESREAVAVISEWVEWEYLNVFPKSVKTIEPKVRV